jgi:threonylcarbamoyladenosine tRNA methylthiotransferase MtaB
MRDDLERAGWVPAEPSDDDADVVVVNTCTVTARADQESRQWIRRLARTRPGARIVVTGCYAQRAPEELRALPGVSLVLGTAEREEIAAWLPASRAPAHPGAGERPPIDVAVAPARARRAIAASTPTAFGRTRALLKVQDGCDSFCTYCIVPYVRGRARSLAVSVILDQARRLLDAGFHELVLTGADLGSYGDDRTERPRLAALIEALLALGASHRVRLSSIEPHKVPPELIDLLGTEPRLCRHLHLPLQSGSAAVLRAMRRAYEPGAYARLVERAASRGPMGIGADVIVGFPGEGEAEFEETVSFVRSLPLSYLHVFRYSPRPGTASVRGERGVSVAVARERSERLRRMGDEMERRFHDSLVGATLPCVPERGRHPDGAWRGTSDVYAPVCVDGAPPEAAIIPVRIRERLGGELRGVVAPG